MVNVVKAAGDIEQFNEDKIRSSIGKIGVKNEIQDQVINSLKTKLYEGIHTSEIYNHISNTLGISNQPFTKAKYGIKKAIIDLGPTGHPFEDFTAELLKKQGYITQVRLTMSGKCISHEIDVLAQKNNKKYMVECKFHNKQGTKTDCHIPMYTKARLDDLKFKTNLDQAWLITNTKLTSDALSYALCEDIMVLSWNYPENKGFVDLIEKFGLQPITTLNTLSQNEKQQLLQNHILLARTIIEHPDCLNFLNIPEEKHNQIFAEARFISSE